MRVTKKSSRRVIFFAVNVCDGLTRLTAKKKLHDVTIFLLHAFTAKKNYTNYNIRAATSSFEKKALPNACHTALER